MRTGLDGQFDRTGVEVRQRCGFIHGFNNQEHPVGRRRPTGCGVRESERQAARGGYFGGSTGLVGSDGSAGVSAGLLASGIGAGLAGCSGIGMGTVFAGASGIGIGTAVLGASGMGIGAVVGGSTGGVAGV